VGLGVVGVVLVAWKCAAWGCGCRSGGLGLWV
jgi:hypothetical protein